MVWKKSLVGGLVTAGLLVCHPGMASAESVRLVTAPVPQAGAKPSDMAAAASIVGATQDIHCSLPTVTAGASSGDLIRADMPSSVSGARLFDINSAFHIQFMTNAPAADHVTWSVKDYVGQIRGSGSFAVPAGAQTAMMSCTGTASGYFALSASLTGVQGAALPAAGTRPAGMATFGILPYVASVLPPAVFSSQDQHRFGMQGEGDKPELLKALGVTQAIDWRQLSAMEPTKPNTWMPSLDQLAPLYKEGSIARLIRLDGIPAWASPTGQYDQKTYAPKDLAYYQNYMARVGQDAEAIRQAYFPNMKNNYYQVTWEPQWKDSPANFVAMYKAVYKGLHSTDPHAVVMGVTSPDPGMNGYWCTGTLLQTYASLGLGNYIDGVTTHSYYVNHVSPKYPPEWYDTSVHAYEQKLALDHQIRDLRAQMQAIKPNMRLWSTEVGVAYDPDIPYGSDKLSANQLYAQAAVATRIHLVVLGEGAQVTYFFYGSDYPPEKWPGQPDLVGFGTFFDLANPQGDFHAVDLSPKPQAMAFAALTRIVDGTATLGRLKTLPPTVYGYAFRRLGYGPVITALWTHANANWPKADGTYSSTADTAYTLTVDAPGTSGEVNVFDMMGNRTRMTYANGVVSLALSEAPIYVVSANAVVAKANVTAPVGYTGQ